jgi:hypothetical protein
MGRLSDNILGELRSMAKALTDLVEKHNGIAVDHPERSALALMIRRLQGEIAFRQSRPPAPQGACAE